MNVKITCIYFAEIKNEWRYTSTLLRGFHGVDNNNFTMNRFIYWYVVYHYFHSFGILISILLSSVKLTLGCGVFFSRLIDTKSQVTHNKGLPAVNWHKIITEPE
jgi:hypothetical protein